MEINKVDGMLWIAINEDCEEESILIRKIEFDEDREWWMVYYLRDGEEHEGVLLDDPRTDDGWNFIADDFDVEDGFYTTNY